MAEDKLVQVADGGSRPIPDPTVLTTQAVAAAMGQIHRELANLKELLETRVDCAQKLGAEKHNEISERIAAAEATRLEQKKDTRESISAALLAQQAAQDKSERAVKDQLDQLRTTIANLADDLRRNIGELKDTTTTRLGLAESRLTAAEGQKLGAKDNTMMVGGGVAIIMVVLALMGWIASHTVSQQQAYPPSYGAKQ